MSYLADSLMDRTNVLEASAAHEARVFQLLYTIAKVRGYRILGASSPGTHDHASDTYSTRD